MGYSVGCSHSGMFSEMFSGLFSGLFTQWDVQ